MLPGSQEPATILVAFPSWTTFETERKIMKRILARAAAFAVFAVSPLVLAAPAHAAAPADTAAAACGSGYHVEDSETMGYGQNVIAYLLYSTRTGENCAVTVKTRDNHYYGRASGLGAGLKRSGGSWTKDDRSYRYYAGPVYVHAPHACVEFWGHDEEIGADTVHQWHYTSPPEFCR